MGKVTILRKARRIAANIKITQIEVYTHNKVQTYQLFRHINFSKPKT